MTIKPDAPPLDSNAVRANSVRVGRYAWVLTGGWTLLVGAVLLWTVHHQRLAHLEVTRHYAHTTVDRGLLCHDCAAIDGDNLGGINIADRAAPLREITRTHLIAVAMGLCLIWLLGVAGILLLLQRLARGVRERDRTEETLRLHSCALESTANGVLITNRAGLITWANPAFFRLTGYELGEVLGQNPRLLSSNRHDAAYYRELWETITAGRVWHGEIVNRRKNGTLYTEEMTITPVADDRGRLTHYIAIKQDVTDRRQSEEVLRSCLELYRAVESHSADEIIALGLNESVRLTGSATGYFRFVNPDERTPSSQVWTAGQVLRCSPEELEAHGPSITWMDCLRKGRAVLHDESDGQPDEPSQSAGRGPASREMAVPIFEHGRIVAVLGVGGKAARYARFDVDQLSLIARNAWSIVERKRAEADLIEHAAALADASAAKSEFLARMSHELRTPMNSIIGFTEIMIADASDPPDERRARRLEKVHRNARNLLALINDVLDISKIEARRLTLEQEDVDVAALLHECLESVQPLLQNGQVELRHRFDEAVRSGLRWEGDALRLRQIVINLLSNAVKFTREGHIEVRAQADRETLTIEVADTGMGIPARHRSRIFDDFEQVDSSATRRAAGTGLGLSICRKLCALMGGDITVASEPGVGSCFTVRLCRQSARQVTTSLDLDDEKDESPRPGEAHQYPCASRTAAT